MALPDLGVGLVRAKIDTGARSSSLHTFDIELFDRDGVEMVRFRTDPSADPLEIPLVLMRNVRNPGGRAESRPVIRTRVRWNGRMWRIDLNLTRRDEMGFPMLLGRQALRRRLVVDPGRSDLGGPDPLKGAQ